MVALDENEPSLDVHWQGTVHANEIAPPLPWAELSVMVTLAELFDPSPTEAFRMD
jgi:hypothetical protein